MYQLAIPILKGRLRGMRWLPTSGGKILRVLAGTYEKEQTAIVEHLVHPGDVVLDVGAHVGYYTMLFASLVGRSGRVFAFEPDPRNFAFLGQHARLNGRENITVVNAAVGDHLGQVMFEHGSGSGTGHVDAAGISGADAPTSNDVRSRARFPVRMETVDGFARANGIRVDAVKIDVEGAEMAVLQGAQSVLRDFHPIIFLSTHSTDLHRECLDFLRAFGYEFEPIVGRDLDRTTEVFCRVPRLTQ